MLLKASLPEAAWLVAVSPIPQGGVSWKEGRSHPGAPGSTVDLGAVTRDCSSLGWEALTGQVSRPFQPQIQSLLISLSRVNGQMQEPGRD